MHFKKFIKEVESKLPSLPDTPDLVAAGLFTSIEQAHHARRRGRPLNFLSCLQKELSIQNQGLCPGFGGGLLYRTGVQQMNPQTGRNHFAIEKIINEFVRWKIYVATMRVINDENLSLNDRQEFVKHLLDFLRV